ncbi:acetyl-CoA C-acyltransferase [Mycolicibacterium goodii]|nr:acetyl-CoA C-acyltransferase [Mycolicibacterium goodii]MBU8819671.1 acetyl-CoA C-acyltransferase [Mycolicibacterium goodii]MBU8833975.1 acetyl-CoA C-acyltransferase [Mycolicibacterium goodii]
MSTDRTPVLVAATRTPVGRLNGTLAHLSAVDLGAAAVGAVLEPFDGELAVDHIYLGNVVQAGNGQNPARVAAIRGGVPTTVPGTTVNDVCLASMTGVGLAATQIRAGEIDTAIVGGFESMSRAPHGARIRTAAKTGHQEFVDLLVNDGLWCALSDSGMGELSDAANRELGIGRADQDEFAQESHRRARVAKETGRLKQEIGALTDVLEADEGIRPDATIEKLSRLPAAFTADGTITAGNASQMSDAGAAGVLMSRARADSLGLSPLVEVVDRTVVAGPDPTLHLKPAAAAGKLLARNGLSTSEVGLWEINEAFAGVVLASARELDVDLERINVNGGAIALGHPLGASGFRLLLTLAFEMRRREVEFGVAAICGGGGQGQAVLLRLTQP